MGAKGWECRGAKMRVGDDESCAGVGFVEGWVVE